MQNLFQLIAEEMQVIRQRVLGKFESKVKVADRVFSRTKGVKLIQPFVSYLNEEKIEYEKKVYGCSMFEEINVITGRIQVVLDDVSLQFEVVLPGYYPISIFGNQTNIFFLNSETDLDHQLTNNAICLKPAKSSDFETRLSEEIILLKAWVRRYYLGEHEEDRYQYLHYKSSDAPYQSTLIFFTQTDHPFTKGEYGVFEFTRTQKLIDKKFRLEINHVQRFGGKTCQWSHKILNEKPVNRPGYWVYIKDEPILRKRKIVQSWKDLAPYLGDEFVNWLHQQVIKAKRNEIYLMLGYEIGIKEKFDHWQLIKIQKKKFPSKGLKIDGQWKGKLLDIPIHWSNTRDISYSRYFGRGKLDTMLTEYKILILGTGAIGSHLAELLVRGGVKNLHLSDLEYVLPGNVCRSKFSLKDYGKHKVKALRKRLEEISPFVNIETQLGLANSKENGVLFRCTNAILNAGYHYIFDCTANNEVAYLLDKMNLNSTVVNISTSNKAKELVCIVGKQIGLRKDFIFEKLDTKAEITFEGTGCSYPTYEASIVDIAAPISYAVKLINHKLNKGISLSSFIIKTIETDTGMRFDLEEL